MGFPVDEVASQRQPVVEVNKDTFWNVAIWNIAQKRLLFLDIMRFNLTLQAQNGPHQKVLAHIWRTRA